MYRVAAFLLQEWWGDFPKMVDALTVLLLTWNQAYYRYGPFDQQALEDALRGHWGEIAPFRERTILDWSPADGPVVVRLFRVLNASLACRRRDGKPTKSPVSAAKALHLLAPAFFPLWDRKIAEAYRCDYTLHPDRQYLKFCEIALTQARHLVASSSESEKSILKRIDEYNYARYTQGWIG